jgi:replication-associated recombination protein RarA
VPGWLRSGPLADLRSAGQERGGYDNPHGHPGHISEQQLLPQSVVGARFYEPAEAEAELAARLQRIRRARGVDGERGVDGARGADGKRGADAR